MDFVVPADHRVKESKMKNNKLDLAWELKKKQTLKHESDVYTNCSWCFCNCHQSISIGIGGLGNNKKSGDHPITALLRSARILRVQKTLGELRSLKLQ